MNRRFLAIAISVALAVLGIVLVLAYVHSEAENVADGQQAVLVWVAAQQVPAGTSLSTAINTGLVTRERYPRASLPRGYVVHPSHQEYVEVFTTALHRAQVIVAGDFGAKSQTTPLTPPQGNYAQMSLPVCQSVAAAGWIGPGSQIAVLDTSGKSQPVQASCMSHEQTPGGTMTTIVAEGLEVLSVTGAPPPASTSGPAIANGGTGSGCSVDGQGDMCVTVAVPADQVLRLADAAATGDLTVVVMTGQTALPPPGTTYTSKP